MTLIRAWRILKVMVLATEASVGFGVVLKRFRLAAGLTQEMLAERARMSRRGLQDLERSSQQRPRPDTVELLAEALRLSPADRAMFLAAAHRRTGPSAAAWVAVPPPMFPTDISAPLIGREQALAQLRLFLLGKGETLAPSSVMVLAGEPGIGKTRLLQTLARQAGAADWCVLAGGSRRRGGEEPYVPLVDALAAHLRALSPAGRRAALAECAWLGRLLPELETLACPPLPPDQERRLMYKAVERFLDNVAGPAGTLLLLDDVQWAGPDALDLIHNLARAANSRLRIVCAYRSTEIQASDSLSELLSDLAQARLVQYLPIGPLDPRDAEALLADLLVDVAVLPRAPVERALERAGGVPFFLVSYAQALHQGSTEGVPWDLAQGVSRRVALLPEAARRLLDAAAIVGRRVPRALLSAIVRQSEDATVAGLEAACTAHLLLEKGDAEYLFAHDVIREVVEAGMSAARRAALHRKVAEALERGPVAPAAELLAYHFSRGDEPEKAVGYLERAGDHARDQRAHTAAEVHYLEVLALLDRLGRTYQAGLVREKLGGVLSLSGRYDDAIPLFEQAAAAYRAAGDLEGLGRVSVGIGDAHAMRGTPTEGIAHIQPLLAELDRSGASTHVASLYVGLSTLMAVAGRYGESLAVGERAADLSRTSGDDRALVRAMWNRANLLQLLGRIEEARQADQALLPLAEAVDDVQCVLAVHRDLAYICVLRGAFDDAIVHIDHSLALAASLGNPAKHSLTLGMRGWFAFLRGNSWAAHVDLDQALRLSREVDQSWYSTYPLIFLARLSLAEDNPESAASLVMEALALTEASGDLQARRLASTTMAEIDILEGRPAAARDRLMPLLDREGLEECDVTMLLPVLAWAQLEQGQVDPAALTVEQAIARARPEDMRLVLVEALRVQAMVALHREQWNEAAHALGEGITLARNMPNPHALARLLDLQGQLSAHSRVPPSAALST